MPFAGFFPLLFSIVCLIVVVSYVSYVPMLVYEYVHVFVTARARACVCVCACVRACVRASVCVLPYLAYLPQHGLTVAVSAALLPRGTHGVCVLGDAAGGHGHTAGSRTRAAHCNIQHCGQPRHHVHSIALS